MLLDLVNEDPSPAVRESAIVLVVRIAAGTPIDQPYAARMRAILEEAEAGPLGIQVAMLGAMAKGAPLYQANIAMRGLASAAAEVQAEAFETLLRLDTPATAAAARTWFRESRNPAKLVERWLRAADAASLADAMTGLPSK